MSQYFYQIRNWSQFQHYHDRNPPWIKLHYDLLSSADWVSLRDDASRTLAIACMLIASRHEGKIPDSAYVERVAYLNSKPNFKPLVEVGFLDVIADASAALADASDSVSVSSSISEGGLGGTKTSARQIFQLPDWVPKEPWSSFEEMRQRIRKPMTNRARELTICDLERLHKSGCDPGSVLLQSVKNSWQGVFALKENHGNGGTNPRQPTKSERAKAAIIRAAVAGGYAPPGFAGETSLGDDAVSVFSDPKALREGT